MYILSSLTLLLAASAVQPYSSCNQGNWNRAKSMFNAISNDVINHDHDIKETCKHFGQYSAREVFGGNSFRLEVMCSGFDSATWVVMVKHRVIYINGHYPQVGKTCDLTYADIKVLPHFADTHNAAWTYSNGMFVVAFPFKYTLDAHQLSCSQDIDETLITVRKGFPNERIFADN